MGEHGQGDVAVPGGKQATVRSGSDPLADDYYVDDDFDVVDAVRAVAAE